MNRLEEFERNRIKTQDPLDPETISGMIFDCTLDFVKSFSENTADQNKNTMIRIVKAGQDAIEKAMEDFKEEI